jgi:hypothetical protein
MSINQRLIPAIAIIAVALFMSLTQATAGGLQYVIKPFPQQVISAMNRSFTGDDACQAFTLFHPFKIYGTFYSTIYVSTNGYVTFDKCHNEAFNHLQDWFVNTRMVAVEPLDLKFGDAPSGVYVDNTPFMVTVTWHDGLYAGATGLGLLATAQFIYGYNLIILRYYLIPSVDHWGQHAFGGVSTGDGTTFTFFIPVTGSSYGLIDPLYP